MADQAAYTQIASDPVIKTAPKVGNYQYTPEEQKEKTTVDTMLEVRQSYAKNRLIKEREWTEAYKMYMSWIDTARNPFLSNLFIPKTHEAVEILAAFLIGTNQSIKAEPENNGDSYKATVAGKWLDFMWRKQLKARIKILTWLKQGIVFGNGIMKVGWDEEDKKPFMSPTAIEDVYFDYFEPDLQESEWIFHEIRRSKDDVANDEKYTAKTVDGTLIRTLVVSGGQSPYSTEATYKFSSYDKSLTGTINEGKVIVCEGWCEEENKLITIAPTQEGWRILREVDNPHYYSEANSEKTPFRPFVKLRFKTSPLGNRAYDTGAVYPTVNIQKSFNNLVNQYFDNVVMINNPMWIKRRGARINPNELVRRAGGVISVGDINQDLKPEVISDVKQSIIEMLNRLDNEFQQASMVINLLKGIGGESSLATEVQLGQQNAQTLLDMVDENIGDALSELGDMLLNISLQNEDGVKSIKMFENDTHVGVLEFDPSDIVGKYDIRISADRSAGQSKVVRQKQLLDFVNIISRDPTITQQFPNLKKKTYEKWLEEAGFNDTEYFFEGQVPAQPTPATPATPALGGSGSSPPLPGMDKLLTEAANLRSVQPGGPAVA